MTGNWPSYRFLQIEAWNACRIFYSLGLMRPLQVSKKNFWDIFSKIRFHSFVGLDLENRLSTHNMVISLELKATKNQKWKNPKSLTWVPFWNNRLQMLTKMFTWRKSPNFILQNPSFDFFISYVVPEIFQFLGSSTRCPDFEITTFKSTYWFMKIIKILMRLEK